MESLQKVFNKEGSLKKTLTYSYYYRSSEIEEFVIVDLHSLLVNLSKYGGAGFLQIVTDDNEVCTIPIYDSKNISNNMELWPNVNKV